MFCWGKGAIFVVQSAADCREAHLKFDEFSAARLLEFFLAIHASSGSCLAATALRSRIARQVWKRPHPMPGSRTNPSYRRKPHPRPVSLHRVREGFTRTYSVRRCNGLGYGRALPCNPPKGFIPLESPLLPRFSPVLDSAFYELGYGRALPCNPLKGHDP